MNIWWSSEVPDQKATDLDEEISIAKRAENEALRAHYDRVDSHYCD
jgi:hypothetical protein